MKRIWLAFGYSWQGLCAAFKSEAAFRQELVVCVVLIPVALLVDVTSAERALMIASLLLVLIVELLNSAIESVVDRVGREQHELSGRAKDQASAAVLIALILAIVVWTLVLWP